MTEPATDRLSSRRRCPTSALLIDQRSLPSDSMTGIPTSDWPGETATCRRRWSEGTVEVEGRVGPEFAAELNAPGLTVICRGNAADGPGRGLRAGRVLILGDAEVAIGYAQEGGVIVVAGSAGPRAGLGQRGGSLILLSDVGQLVGERQSGGRIYVFGPRLGKHTERGRRGGQVLRLASPGDPLAALDPAEATAFRELGRSLLPWVILPGSEP